jgi:hypothetical protein
MRDGGKTTKQMARAASFMLMETSTTVNGKMIRLTGSESTVT